MNVLYHHNFTIHNLGIFIFIMDQNVCTRNWWQFSIAANRGWGNDGNCQHLEWACLFVMILVICIVYTFSFCMQMIAATASQHWINQYNIHHQRFGNTCNRSCWFLDNCRLHAYIYSYFDWNILLHVNDSDQLQLVQLYFLQVNIRSCMLLVGL